MSKPKPIYRASPGVRAFQDVEDFKNVFGELHPSIEEKMLKQMTKEEVVHIALTAMCGLASPGYISKCRARIRDKLESIK